MPDAGARLPHDRPLPETGRAQKCPVRRHDVQRTIDDEHLLFDAVDDVLEVAPLPVDLLDRAGKRGSHGVEPLREPRELVIAAERHLRPEVPAPDPIGGLHERVHPADDETVHQGGDGHKSDGEHDEDARGEVIGLQQDRNEDSLRTLLHERLDARQRAAVEAVCTDMHRPYVHVVREVLPHAEIVFDKFHVLPHASAALDEVRRQDFFRAGAVMRAHGRGKRWLLLRRWQTVRGSKRAELQALFGPASSMS